MTPERLEVLLNGAAETDAIEFKAPMSWDKNVFVKDILALSNVIDGGVIIVGVDDTTFVRRGVSIEQGQSFDFDIMRDQIATYADPRVIFSRHLVSDAHGLSYIVIQVSPFEEIPVICARDGHDVKQGTIYFRSRSRRPASARVSNSSDMREVIEVAIARRARQLNRIGFASPPPQYDFDAELGGL